MGIVKKLLGRLYRKPEVAPQLQVRYSRHQLSLISTHTTLLRWDLVDFPDVIAGATISHDLLETHGTTSSGLIPEQTQELHVTIASKAVVCGCYGAYDLQGIPLDGCFYFRAGLFIHGSPAPITPPRRSRCAYVPWALFINNLELGHFGHLLTDGCAAIYPLLLWSQRYGHLGRIPVIVNQQLAHRSQELLDLFDGDAIELMIPTINTKPLVVGQLVTPVPSMLNGGIVQNGGYVNRHHPAVVRALLAHRTVFQEPRLNPRSSTDRFGSHVMSASAQALSCPSKLYLSRSHLSKQKRRFVQEEALEFVLESLGWTIVHPEELPLSEQLRLLQGFTHLCAPQGSALHLLFAIHPRPGMHVIMLTTANVNWNYINQFATQDLRHECLECLESFGDQPELGLRDVRLLESWDPNRLAHTIDSLASDADETGRHP